MKKVISVINQKGGVGKTTTSINFACGLSREGYKVLLIDLDPQAHSTLGVGIDHGSYQKAVHDVLLNREKIENVILKTQIENLEVVPSHIRLDKAEQQLTPEMFKESRLQKAIKNLAYDFVVIDCRPTLGTLTVNALYASDFILVPCEVARYSLDGFADLMDTIDTVKNDDEFNKKERIRILLTKYDSRKTISNDWVLQQLEPFNRLLLNVRIRQNEALNQAHMAQEPIFMFKPNSPGAQDYEQLTKEFLSLCHP